jgi:hypothetical protein
LVKKRRMKMREKSEIATQEKRIGRLITIGRLMMRRRMKGKRRTKREIATKEV